jgi:hypothetical protein
LRGGDLATSRATVGGRLLEQISAFLQRQLQLDLIHVDGGEFNGDAFGAIGTASHELESEGLVALRSLTDAIDRARQAIAYATYTEPGASKR